MDKIMAWGIAQNTGAGNAHVYWFATEEDREEYYYNNVNVYAGCNRVEPRLVSERFVIPSYDELMSWTDERIYNTADDEIPVWIAR